MAGGPAPPFRAPADRVAFAVATGLGSGYSPVAPGTAGSLLGLLLFWPLSYLPVPLQALAVLSLFVAGAFAGTRVAERVGRKDPGLVVVDEVVGMWTTLLWIPLGAGTAIAGFFAFRLMDIVKPFPARRLEDLPAGWGIMADDLMAGIYANLLVRLVALVLPLGLA